jgi:hypothetical protein
MTNANYYPGARIIARPKLIGVGEHWGVELPNGLVAHHSPEGEKIVTFDEFAQHRPVKEIKRADPALNTHIMGRAITSVQRPGIYHLFDRNCETYATWLIGEKPHSPQVLGVAILGAVVICAALLQ